MIRYKYKYTCEYKYIFKVYTDLLSGQPQQEMKIRVDVYLKYFFEIVNIRTSIILDPMFFVGVIGLNYKGGQR